MEATETTIQTIKVPVTSPEYVAMLERVNEVNGTGLALANALIALLACALTIAGVFAAYIMWRNSREQKEERRRIYAEHGAQLTEQYNLLVTTYEEKIKSLMEKIESIATTAEDTGNSVADTKQQLEALVSDYQAKLTSLKGSSQQNNFIVTSVEDIPTAKTRIATHFQQTLSQIYNANNALFDIKRCPSCNKEYRVQKYAWTRGSGLYEMECPHCGAIL